MMETIEREEGKKKKKGQPVESVERFWGSHKRQLTIVQDL